MKNITNPDQTSLLLEDLIIWTNYEIEVAAYNGAGRGTYSHKVTEWTLQGGEASFHVLLPPPSSQNTAIKQQDGLIPCIPKRIPALSNDLKLSARGAISKESSTELIRLLPHDLFRVFHELKASLVNIDKRPHQEERFRLFKHQQRLHRQQPPVTELQLQRLYIKHGIIKLKHVGLRIISRIPRERISHASSVALNVRWLYLVEQMPFITGSIVIILVPWMMLSPRHGMLTLI